MQARPQGSPSFWLEEKRGQGPRKLRDQTAPAPAASCPLGPCSATAPRPPQLPPPPASPQHLTLTVTKAASTADVL